MIFAYLLIKCALFYVESAPTRILGFAFYPFKGVFMYAHNMDAFTCNDPTVGFTLSYFSFISFFLIKLKKRQNYF